MRRLLIAVLHQGTHVDSLYDDHSDRIRPPRDGTIPRPAGGGEVDSCRLPWRR